MSGFQLFYKNIQKRDRCDPQRVQKKVISRLISICFRRSESELIHFFESRFLDESKLIHSGVYTNLYAHPL